MTADAAAALRGPLRIRDMTPFSLLRLDLLPPPAMAPGAWALEASVSHANTFVMSDNVRAYLEERGGRGPLTEADVAAIMAAGDDVYYVDGEFGLLEVTASYAPTERWTTYLTLPVYYLGGGIMDATIEGFHDSIGFDDAGRDLAARDHFQLVTAIEGVRLTLLEAPYDRGLGDPVVGLRHQRPLAGQRWSLAVEMAVKIATHDAEGLHSTGSHDVGMQVALARRAGRNGLYASASVVHQGGRIFGVEVGERLVPSLLVACERAFGARTSLVLQLDAGRSTVRNTPIEEIKENKYQATVGVRRASGRFVYGLGVTENLDNFANTPDIGLALTLAWIGPGRDRPAS